MELSGNFRSRPEVIGAINAIGERLLGEPFHPLRVGAPPALPEPPGGGAAVELLLTALAGCGAIDVDLITGKRAAPTSFAVRATGDKVRDEGGNHLTNLRVSFDITWPEGEGGDRAREVLPRTLAQVRDRLCTVSRTVAIGEPVDFEGT